MYTITNAMQAHINYIKESVTWFRRLTEQEVEAILLDKAQEAYRFLCVARQERMDYSPVEFIQKCKANENFFNYYLAYAE